MQYSLALLAVLILASPVRAWGADGHRVVAVLAERYLGAASRAEIAKLLLPGQRLADVADWADEHRKRCHATSRWHYVNIPITAVRYVPARQCVEADGGCVVSAIERSRAVLRDPQQTRDDRALALRYLVHFVGDLHQPLHSGDRNDRGGNDLQVRFAGRKTNLHRVWDHALLEWTGRSVADYADMLARSLRPVEKKQLARGNAAAWAEEAARISRRAYARLPKPGERQRGNAPIELGDDYASAMLPALDEQLLRAGVRLAYVLESAFARPEPATEADLASIRRCRGR